MKLFRRQKIFSKNINILEKVIAGNAASERQSGFYYLFYHQRFGFFLISQCKTLRALPEKVFG
jgi:hypothetical protein